jgi:hypothetical protein
MPRAVLFSTQRLARRWDSSIFTVRRLIKSGDVPARQDRWAILRAYRYGGKNRKKRHPPLPDSEPSKGSRHLHSP